MTSPLCDGIESCSFTSFNLGRLTTNRSEQHVPTTQDTTGRSAPFGQLQARPGSPAGVLRRQYRDNFLACEGASPHLQQTIVCELSPAIGAFGTRSAQCPVAGLDSVGEGG